MRWTDRQTGMKLTSRAVSTGLLRQRHRLGALRRQPAPEAGRAAGPLVVVRELRRDDVEALDKVFAKMSAESRYFRFHATVNSLAGARREALLDVDDFWHVALVAHIGPQPTAVARFIRNRRQPHEAEIAIGMADEWHGHGIGRLLLNRLYRRAAADGVQRLTASVMASNRSALGLLRSACPNVQATLDSGVIDFTVTVPRYLAPC